MKRFAFVLCLLSAPAFAQQPPNPCQHGTTRIVMAGIDPDATRCELAIANATIADLTGQNIKLMAALKMAESDAAAEKAAQATAAAEAKKKVDAATQAKKTDPNKPAGDAPQHAK